MKHVQFCSGSYSFQYFSPCSSNIFIELVELLQSLVIKRTALRGTLSTLHWRITSLEQVERFH